MQAQIMLHDGPYDMHIVSYAVHGGFFPLELRVAETKDAEESAVYRKIDVEKLPAPLMMAFASYRFVEIRPTRKALIDVVMEGKR